jgi:hypothetical protein
MIGGLFRGGEGEGEARAEQVFVGTWNGAVTFGRSKPSAGAGYFNFRLLVFWSPGLGSVALGLLSLTCRTTAGPRYDRQTNPVQLANTPAAPTAANSTTTTLLPPSLFMCDLSFYGTPSVLNYSSLNFFF